MQRLAKSHWRSCSLKETTLFQFLGVLNDLFEWYEVWANGA